MPWDAWPPLLVLLSSLVPGLLIFFLGEARRRTRTVLNLAGAIAKLSLVAYMLWGVLEGHRYAVRLAVLPGLELALEVDALAMLFVTLSACLWLLTTIYAIGYLEGSPNRSRFFGFFSLCVSATMGIALAANLFTLFVFYEVLTLTTYPLIVHRGTTVALRAGGVYLRYTLAGSALLLIAVVWLQVVAGPFDFAARGGALGHVGAADAGALTAIFALLVAGFGVKAALVPLHGWLPVAMVAPAPVSALLHAVAVVKAGAFGIVRVVYDVYGIDLTRELGVAGPLAALAAATIVYGSLRALAQDDLKRRLAFSTVSQVSYIVLGTAILGPAAAVGGLVHLVHQGLMKITLFFCAGNLAETLGIHSIREMNGVGRRMPWTMAAFSLAAFGLIGAPPLAGFVSKWYLGLGAYRVGEGWVIAVLAASALLNAAYFLPILHRVWFRPRHRQWHVERFGGRFETSPVLLGPPLVTALMALAAGLFADNVLSPLNWARLIALQEFGP